jgi:hypothetical protein
MYGPQGYLMRRPRVVGSDGTQEHLLVRFPRVVQGPKSETRPELITDLVLKQLMSSPRRFPPPWTAEEVTPNCFAVTDANGQKLAYIY